MARTRSLSNNSLLTISLTLSFGDRDQSSNLCCPTKSINMLLTLYTFAIILFSIIVLYILFYPKTNCIYLDKRGNKIKTLDINKFTITYVYILDDLQETSIHQNCKLFEFIKEFRLWKML